MLKNKIKKIIEKNTMLFNIIQIIRYRKNQLYMHFVKGAFYDSNIIEFKLGQNNFTPSLPCLLEVGNRHEGLCALLRRVLNGLYFCDKMGFVPVIKIVSDSLYFDSNVIETSNIYEYYFNQPSSFTYEDLEKTTYAEYTYRNSLMAENLIQQDEYIVSGIYIEEMSKLVSKYIKPKDNLIQVVKKNLKTIGIGNRTLGVHIRGTDFKGNYKNHPKYVSPKDYYPIIHHLIKENRYENIFLATDDSDVLNDFIKEFGANVVLYSKEIQRASGDVGVHVKNQNNKYKLGLDVLCDIAYLASCKGFVSGISQVSIMTRILKKSKEEYFIDDRIVSKGINHHGKTFLVENQK